MSTLIAYCGLDCAECPAYTATQANDREAQERLLAQWRVEFNSPDMDLSAVQCDGCTSTGRLGGYCSACPIRACNIEHDYANCAHCPEYACETASGMLSQMPHAKARLDSIRITLS